MTTNHLELRDYVRHRAHQYWQRPIYRWINNKIDNNLQFNWRICVALNVCCENVKPPSSPLLLLQKSIEMLRNVYTYVWSSSYWYFHNILHAKHSCSFSYRSYSLALTQLYILNKAVQIQVARGWKMFLFECLRQTLFRSTWAEFV